MTHFISSPSSTREVSTIPVWAKWPSKLLESRRFCPFSTMNSVDGQSYVVRRGMRVNSICLGCSSSYANTTIISSTIVEPQRMIRTRRSTTFEWETAKQTSDETCLRWWVDCSKWSRAWAASLLSEWIEDHASLSTIHVRSSHASRQRYSNDCQRCSGSLRLRKETITSRKKTFLHHSVPSCSSPLAIFSVSLDSCWTTSPAKWYNSNNYRQSFTNIQY